jgi:hypothetical protein
LLVALGPRGAAQEDTGKRPEPVDVSSLRDVTGIERPPPPPPRPRWPLALALALAVVVSLNLVFLGRKLARWRARRKADVPPDRWALTELDRVEALALPSAGEVEQFHRLLSDVVRRYLEMRFGVHAPQQTTPEFLAAMRHSPQLPAALQALLQDFLERCDLAKFARAGFSPSDCQEAAGMARAFVLQTTRPALPSRSP